MRYRCDESTGRGADAQFHAPRRFIALPMSQIVRHVQSSDSRQCSGVVGDSTLDRGCRRLVRACADECEQQGDDEIAVHGLVHSEDANLLAPVTRVMHRVPLDAQVATVLSLTIVLAALPSQENAAFEFALRVTSSSVQHVLSRLRFGMCILAH